ncbi:MAG: hypothetical protein KAS66_05615 [Candidatus Omnitrophica bacterium]|nr:hypothetical protein [Candidatus Omnitrophota bacterium]
MDVKVYLGKEMLRSDGATGQKYEVTVYPVPEDHTKIADLIRNAIMDA